MNRLLVAVAAVSVFAFGCTAEGTEDPEPSPPVEEPQRDPPKQIKAGNLVNPYDNISVPLDYYQRMPDEPTLQQPRLPGR